MSDLEGTFQLGPETAQLTVLTGTAGPAARLGHNLEIVVEQWHATLELGREQGSKLTLKADGASLRVRGGRGSLTPISAGDMRAIQKAIEEKVLKRSTVRFSSASIVAADGQALDVDGTLTLLGSARPLRFQLELDPAGALYGEAKFKQSDWGIKPFAVMGGAMKVADLVTVTVAGQLPEPQ